MADAGRSRFQIKEGKKRNENQINQVSNTLFFSILSSIADPIKMIGFQIIIELCKQAVEETASNHNLKKYLSFFFQRVFEVIFTEPITNNEQTLRTVARALYSLCYCYRNTYRDMVREVLRSLGDANAEEQIANTLFTLVNEIGLDRYHEGVGFIRKFDEFLTQVQNVKLSANF